MAVFRTDDVINAGTCFFQVGDNDNASEIQNYKYYFILVYYPSLNSSCMSQHSVKVLCNIFECTGSIKHKILFCHRILRLENHRNVKMANSQPGVYQQKPKIPADSLVCLSIFNHFHVLKLCLWKSVLKVFVVVFSLFT